MFEKLKSMLSVSVAPGGSNVHVAPFSFPFCTRIEVRAAANEDAKQLAFVLSELDYVAELLEADDLTQGRASLDVVRRDLAQAIGE